MRIFKPFTALAATAALITGTIVVPAVPVAHAEIRVNGGLASVEQADTNGGAFTGFDLNTSRKNYFRYSNPLSAPGLLELGFQTSVHLGSWERFNDDNTTMERIDANTVVMTTDHGDGRRVVRTYEFNGSKATVSVEASRADGGQVIIDLTNSFTSATPKYTVTKDGTNYHLVPDSAGYELALSYEGAYQSGYADEHLQASDEHPGQFRFQQGRWGGHGSVTATATIEVSTQLGAADQDGDGLPDQWEDEGVTIDGQTFDLPRWGARSDQKDLFLQLNWMESEWETNKCIDAVDPIKLAECGRMDTTSFRPQRSTLIQLEKLFAEHGIALHIDAGPVYSPDFNLDETQGGKTLPYTQFPFDSGNPLQDYKDDLGARENIFRRGVIGGQMEDGDVKNASSGRGVVSGSTFYVAKLPQMTEDDVRNTILHEFGHTLGLHHDGAETAESRANPGRNYIPEYKSTMNYLYQFDKNYGFVYSTEAVQSGPRSDAELKNKFPACKTQQCFTGEFNIPEDWPNLALRNPALGKSAGVIGLPEEHDEHADEDRSVRELEIIAAESNNGKGGLSNDTDSESNTVTVGNPDNSIRMIVDNKGLDPEVFTLEVSWPKGSVTKRVATDGILREKYQRAVDIDLGALEGYGKNNMPVTFTLRNSKQVVQEHFTVDIPVIRATKEEAKKALAAVENHASEQIKKDLKANLEPLVQPTTPPAPTTTRPAPTPAPTTVPTSVSTPTPITPTPIPTRATQTPVPTPEPQPSNGSSASTGIIVGIVLAIGGALAAAFGWWANTSGMF